MARQHHLAADVDHLVSDGCRDRRLGGQVACEIHEVLLVGSIDFFESSSSSLTRRLVEHLLQLCFSERHSACRCWGSCCLAVRCGGLAS